MRVKPYKNANNSRQLWLVEECQEWYVPLYKVMPVFWFESELNQGRFHRYSSEKQRFVIKKEVPQVEAATVQKVEWIAENIEQLWSLNVVVREDSGELHYSFAGQRDAALFMMMF